MHCPNSPPNSPNAQPCESAWGPDPDRRDKPLTSLIWAGSTDDNLAVVDDSLDVPGLADVLLGYRIIPPSASASSCLGAGIPRTSLTLLEPGQCDLNQGPSPDAYRHSNEGRSISNSSA